MWLLMSPEVCQELDNLLARGHHGDEDAILLQPGAGDVGDGHLHGDMERSHYPASWLLTADLHEVVVLPHHAVNLHTPLTVRQSDQNIGHI